MGEEQFPKTPTFLKSFFLDSYPAFLLTTTFWLKDAMHISLSLFPFFSAFKNELIKFPCSLCKTWTLLDSFHGKFIWGLEKYFFLREGWKMASHSWLSNHPYSCVYSLQKKLMLFIPSSVCFNLVFSWVVASCTCNSGYIIIFSNIMDYDSMPLKSKKLNPDDFNLNAFQTLGIIFKQRTKNGYSHSQFLWITDLLCYMKYIFLFSSKALRNNIIYFQKPLCLATSSSRFR